MNNSITTALLDSDRDYCRLLKAVLESDSGLHRVSVYFDPVQASLELPGLDPDVLLADLSFANGAGAEFVKALRIQVPRTAIIILSRRLDEASIVGAFRGGATGYLLKDTPLANVSDAVKDAKAGRCPLSARVARALVEWFHARSTLGRPARELSAREREILGRVARGVRNREIAQALCLSEATVRAHLQTAYKKLNVHTRAQAAACLSC